MKHSINLWLLGALSGILGVRAAASPASSETWQSAAQWHRVLRKAVPGTLQIGRDGVEFQSATFTGHWAYTEIHTFDLSANELTLTTYEDRHWHEPGERRYHFSLREPMPSGIAATLTARVGKPVRHGIPRETATSFAAIPAHIRARFGGSNGTLRLKDDGIDYVTQDGRDSRSWRWADIQTIANPNPYELRVTAYREIAEFELKRALPRAQFERLWDRLYASGLNVFPRGGSR
ncbi:MAG TPA: hypothetical protein VGG15_02630 [Terriglobales bacterium]|jgi:hypothetical protein